MGGVRNPVIKINNSCIKFRNNVKILRIVINRFLNWIDHAKYVKNKMGRKGREIRKISTLNWGLSPAVIKRIYIAGFERAIVYGARVWWGYGDNNKSLIKILRSTQRPFALAICRGYNTLSTDAALFLSGLIPIELVLNFESKITCLNRPINILKMGPNSNVLDIPSLNYFCDPADHEIINFTKELPTTNDLIIYTDGSKSENGVAENLAIFKALEWFEDNNKFKSVHIASDSLSSLLAINSPLSKTWTIMRTKLLINIIRQKNKLIRFYWVKSHIGTIGNEQADKLAKEAYQYPAPYQPIPIPKSYMKNFYKKEILGLWQDLWDKSVNGFIFELYVLKESLEKELDVDIVDLSINRRLLKHILPSCGHHVHPRLHNGLQNIDVGVSVHPKALLKEMGRHDITFTADNAKDHYGGRKFRVHHDRYL
ncbi:hypothetical protein LAZ67_20000639 [Cordylochernes scorpioides]|uniref:ribonuclease H n=1 Tax=Cordylochernes scorpioides TaxID=51811 RepID=A0ABY6LLL1_9ARAC|nr:hypothetical protein LAZ67_20000639 [Cordylochernes scorpioides]